MKRKQTSLGRKIAEGLEDALTHRKGRARLRETVVEILDAPPQFSAKEVSALRHRLVLSQTGFAACLGVSAAAIRSWEQGQKSPSGAACRLLQIIKSSPEVLKKLSRAA